MQEFFAEDEEAFIRKQAQLMPSKYFHFFYF